MADLIDELSSLGVDTTAAMPRFSNNREMYMKYILKFPEESAIAAFRKELADENYASAAEYIHDFKGTTGTMGMTELFRLSSEIMTLLRSGNYASAKGLSAELFAEYDRISAVIKNAK